MDLDHREVRMLREYEQLAYDEIAEVLTGDDGFATAAQLAAPSQVTVDAAGNLYIADIGNNRIRKVELGGLTRVGTFPQVASGGGWKTTLSIANLSSIGVTARLTFYTEAGTPLLLPLVLPDGSRVTDSVADLTIQPYGSATVETEASTPSADIGWADVRATGFLNGYAIFANAQPGDPTRKEQPKWKQHLLRRSHLHTTTQQGLKPAWRSPIFPQQERQ